MDKHYRSQNVRQVLHVFQMFFYVTEPHPGSAQCIRTSRGTAAAAPPPFRPSDPALCGSRPLVTPYYCRLGDLLCYSVYIVLCLHYCLCIFVFSCFRCFLCL